MSTTSTAQDWINTNKTGIIDDIRRLGFDDAADYQMDLIEGCQNAGDRRWDSVTYFEMRAVLDNLVSDLAVDFLIGFSQAAQIDLGDARDQWASFSRQLGEMEILRIELGGEMSGRAEGLRFLECYPAQSM